jgi:hypothetical protein
MAGEKDLQQRRRFSSWRASVAVVSVGRGSHTGSSGEMTPRGAASPATTPNGADEVDRNAPLVHRMDNDQNLVVE